MRAGRLKALATGTELAWGEKTGVKMVPGLVRQKIFVPQFAAVFVFESGEAFVLEEFQKGSGEWIIQIDGGAGKDSGLKIFADTSCSTAPWSGWPDEFPMWSWFDRPSDA